jgi:hypothetical protein
MAQLDVTDVLLDPDVAGDSFIVVRRQEVVDNNGFSQLTITKIPAFGHVSPTGENSLVRLDAYQQKARTIQVITNFALRGPSEDAFGRKWQPDIIQWQPPWASEALHFIVVTINAFTNYGAGFVSAECTTIDFVDQYPVNRPVAV